MALRKLQAEIDKTLKGVAQGVELFESTFDKLHNASNTTQKDKLENDLKTQIKKLQRMRDQIKTWSSNSDIKDKSALVDNRKLIEVQMERFKALEKEMKMKAFSKEGLIAQGRLDPAEKAKRDLIEWVGNSVDELGRQVEGTEAEIESMANMKKKKSAGDRVSELEELNERRTWHVGRLEIVQRMLENGQLQTEQVETIQEDVKYFIEENGEEEFDFDNGIYDELNLQEEEELLGDFAHGDENSTIDSASVADVPEISPAPVPVPAPAPIAKTPGKEEKEKEAKKTPKTLTTPSTEDPPSPLAPAKKPVRKNTMDSAKSDKDKAEIKAAIMSAPAADPPVPKLPAKAVETVPAPKVATALPPIRYAAAAAAAVATTAAVAASAVANGVQAAASSSAPQPSTSVPPVPSTAPAPASPVKQKIEPIAIPDPVPAEIKSPAVAAVSSPATEAPQTNGHAPPPPPGLSAPPARPPSVPAPATAAAAVLPLSSSPQPSAGPYPAEGSRAASAASGYTSGERPSGVMGNLMSSFDHARRIAEERQSDSTEILSALDASYANAPHQLDGEPPRYYHPANPIRTPSHYPQVRLPILEDRKLYERLEADQLFYIFYYMAGTYEQWLVAEELKKQHWRFHKQYQTWFQRAHPPQAMTEDYEQGAYVYFDWENGWCQRKKSDFRFEYRWLEAE